MTSKYQLMPDQPSALLDTIHGPQHVKILGFNPSASDGWMKYVVTDPFLPGSAVYANEDELSEIAGDA